MIIKLTLETESPEGILTFFLQRYDYLRSYPCTTSHITDDKEYHTIFQNDRKYRKLIRLPEEILDKHDNTILVTPSNEEKEWICHIIQQAWNQFAETHSDTDYLKSQFSVSIPETCTGEWGNGKDFYVFPTSYNQKPVLQF